MRGETLGDGLGDALGDTIGEAFGVTFGDLDFLLHGFIWLESSNFLNSSEPAKTSFSLSGESGITVAAPVVIGLYVDSKGLKFISR